MDNVLYYFTPEEILHVERVGTASPTGERRALTGESETMPTPSDSIPQPPRVVNPDGWDTAAQNPVEGVKNAPMEGAGLNPVSAKMEESLSTGKNNFIAKTASDIVTFAKRALQKKGGAERRCRMPPWNL